MNARRAIVALALILGFASGIGSAFAERSHEVVVVPISGQIDEGMAHLVDRSIADARDAHAVAVVLDVNTFGGLVQSGVSIRDAILASPVPVYAFVSHRAISAGALVTLSAAHVIIAPGATYGDAEPIPKTTKTLSYLKKEFAATAQRTHRDPQLAMAMVDAGMSAPPYKSNGQILSLTADEAARTHFADGVANDLPGALAQWHLSSATRTAQYTFGERLARFATNTEVSGLLLSIGFLGLLIEMQTLHGIAGIVGVGALALFFGTHVYAGFSNGFVIALAIAGVTGILFELHVFPGHGVSGSLGIAALLGAVFLAFGGLGFAVVALQALAVAVVLTAICFALATRIYPESAFMRRLVFAGVQGPDYVASADHHELLGMTGIASSYLRPAGVATIDGKRVDVLTEGEFVPAGSPVRVTRVEGARVFVQPS